LQYSLEHEVASCASGAADVLLRGSGDPSSAQLRDPAELERALKISELTRLEIHGMDEELAKLRGPLADFHATYFTLEFGIRR
jgi:hypothetical protein